MLPRIYLRYSLEPGETTEANQTTRLRELILIMTSITKNLPNNCVRYIFYIHFAVKCETLRKHFLINSQVGLGVCEN